MAEAVTPPTATTVITNVSVFDGKLRLDGPKTMVIADSKIESVADYEDDDGDETRYRPGSVTVIDGTGCTVLPGLFDTHVHVSSVRDLESCAVHGVTTVCDMACMPIEKYTELRALSKAGKSPASWLATSKPAYSANSRHGSLFRFMGIGDEHALSTTDDVSAFIEGRVANEVDYVKIIADVPGLPQEVLNAIQTESRKQGLLTVAHTAQHAAFERGLDAGFDVLTHVPMDMEVDAKMARRMVEQRVVAIPTLSMMQALKKSWILWPIYYKSDYAKARRSVTTMHDSGVTILAGSDANAAFVVDNRHGAALLRELELLVAAGLMPTEALEASTSLPAAYFKLDDRGRIDAGLRADLLLVEGDPTVDIACLRKRRHVWSAGTLVGQKQDGWGCIPM